MLRDIYTAPTVAVEARFDEYTTQFGDQYPAAIRLGRLLAIVRAVPELRPEVRKVLSTTNIIES
ncbi:hypothetical protein [Micromonospora sp. WMMD1219]|uniref:hypothetical protein n=1 Tax=Micromonospora sp. WMMD1219 TaxID=3404115 RepID=UPI003BF4B433